MATAYYQQSVEDVAREFGVDFERGLSDDRVTELQAKFGPNELQEAKGESKILKILKQFQSPLVYLLGFALAISLVVHFAGGEGGVPYDAIVIILILIVNAVIGFAQEVKAENALNALKQLSSPLAVVLRNGEPAKIKVSECVPGDILLLGEGDIIPADARLFEAVNFYVAESSLTGESVPVHKTVQAIDGEVALGDRVNMVFSSTPITQGAAKAIVVGVGMETEVGKIASMLAETDEQPSPLTIEMDKLGRVLTILVSAIAVVVVITVLMMQGIENFNSFIQVLLLGVSLAVAAVPEGMLAILSVVMAIGIQVMAKENAIVKKLHSVETLGSVNIICSDKTGTLTKNEMKVEEILDIFGNSASPKVRGSALRIGVLANESSYSAVTKELIGDPTETSLVSAALEFGNYEDTSGKFKIVSRLPFSSVRKRMSVVAESTGTAVGDESGDYTVAIKGAPDVLVARSAWAFDGEKVIAMTPEIKASILASIDDLSDQAFRNLGAAFKMMKRAEFDAIDKDDFDALEAIEDGFIYVGTFGIIDPARPEAKHAIAEAKAGGVRTIMITGDHPLTAAKIAQDLGIIEEGAQIRQNLSGFALSGQDLDRMSDEELIAALESVSVFARVAPEHKFRIVSLLQQAGNIVGMTGDGVNDAPAVKKADIGISMGITGTEVTKSTSKMILADDNFATIVSAISQGRTIFDNIRKSLRFLLTTNSGEVFTVFFGVVFASSIGLVHQEGGFLVSALTATQILWINLLTDSAPALALGMDKANKNVMAQKPRKLGTPIVDKPIWFDVGLFGLIVAIFALLAIDMCLPGGAIPTWFADAINGNASLEHDIIAARSMAFTMIVLSEMVYAYCSRSFDESVFKSNSINKFLIGAVAVSVVLQIAVINLPFLNTAFATTPLTIIQWLICIAFAFLILAISELKKFLIRRFSFKKE